MSTSIPSSSTGSRGLNKGKIKKQQQQIKTHQLSIYQQLLTAAKSDSQLLLTYAPAFSKYKRRKDDIVIIDVDIEYGTAASISRDKKEWMFALTKKHMKEMYEANWGWDDRKKRHELYDDEARYLIVLDKPSSPPLTSNNESITATLSTLNLSSPTIISSTTTAKPVAFLHLRFELEHDLPSLYVFEIQVEESMQKKGIGKFLMQICELLAWKTGMHRVLLTVFKSNLPAQNLYKNTLHYTKDFTDTNEDNDKSYEILSKQNPKIKLAEENGNLH